MCSLRPPRRRLFFPQLLGFAVLAAALLPSAAGAQPFGRFLSVNGPLFDYVSVPDSSDLNPANAITIEAWVKLRDVNDCSSIIGKDWKQSWWVGVCGTTLRSYLKGSGSPVDGGRLDPEEWNHIAVVYDGARRRHYVNGELVVTHNETGTLPSSTAELQIGSDAEWAHTPLGLIEEVALWNVPRTESQIRTDMRGLGGAPAGLVALWHFDNDANDAVGGHDGTLHGTAAFAFLATAPNCLRGASSTALCLLDRFLVTAKYRNGAQSVPEGTAQIVPASNPGSGLFWFFGSDNWEVMVKAINGCPVTNAYWIFSAATTNVFYRMEVLDFPTGNQRIYFNYPGPPAPAVTDTNAFAICP